MVGTDETPDLERLYAWKESLKAKAEALQADLEAKHVALAQLEERLALVSKLIEVEVRDNGDEPTRETVSASLAQKSNSQKPAKSQGLEDAVEEILAAAGEPTHISTIREELVKRGTPIPGRGDDANIIVRLRQDQGRFTRTARGTYALAKWGLPPLASRTTKRRRRVKK